MMLQLFQKVMITEFIFLYINRYKAINLHRDADLPAKTGTL